MPGPRTANRYPPELIARLEIEPPLKIGVVGDTHGSSASDVSTIEMVANLFGRFNVGLILHTGDIGRPFVLQALEECAPVAAVRGNADSLELSEGLPDRIDIRSSKHLIVLLHGHLGKTARAVANSAAGPGVDIVVFGHSHRPLIEREGMTILFNPGSPTQRRWHPHFGVGLLSVTDDAIKPELVLFEDVRHLDNVVP